MGKNENFYIKEFIEYYIKLGVDHIFIYDDNEPNTENISDKIDKSFNKHITIYKNFEDIKKSNDTPPIQPLIFTKCYDINKDKFDWFLMIDMDEYLVIVKDKLKNYLSRKVFKKCDFIKIHWVQPTDNNLLHYDNRSLFERFKGPYKIDGHIKSIIRGHIQDLKYMVHSPYISPKNNITCNNIGEKLNYTKLDFEYIKKKKINIEKAYFIHFKYKSTEEYINKFKRGYSHCYNNQTKIKNWRINEYFEDNEITLEKIEYIEKELKLNLSKYKNQLK